MEVRVRGIFELLDSSRYAASDVQICSISMRICDTLVIVVVMVAVVAAVKNVRNE